MITFINRVESIDSDVTMNLTSTAAPSLLLATLCPLWAGNCPALARVSLLAGRPAVRLVTLLVICWLPAARLTSARLASVFILSKLASSTRPTPRSSSSLYKWISVGTLWSFQTFTVSWGREAVIWSRIFSSESNAVWGLRRVKIGSFDTYFLISCWWWWHEKKAMAMATKKVYNLSLNWKIYNLSLNWQLSRIVCKPYQCLLPSLQLLWKHRNDHLNILSSPLEPPIARQQRT